MNDLVKCTSTFHLYRIFSPKPVAFSRKPGQAGSRDKQHWLSHQVRTPRRGGPERANESLAHLLRRFGATGAASLAAATLLDNIQLKGSFSRRRLLVFWNRLAIDRHRLGRPEFSWRSLEGLRESMAPWWTSCRGILSCQSQRAQNSRH